MLAQGSELRLTGLVGTPWWRSEDSFVHRKGAVMEQNRATIASLSRGITSTSDQPGLSFAVLLTWIRCPELNPVENIWQLMRENWISNRIFASYSDILDHCCDAWNKLTDQPWLIMSIGLRDWAHRF